MKYFLGDPNLYNHYKKNLFNLISIYLTNESYNMIGDQFKEEMANSIINLYMKFFNEYGLKEDIIKYVDENLLIKFGVYDKIIKK